MKRQVKTSEFERRTRKFDVFTGRVHEEVVKQGSVFSVSPRVVCKACNSGWMSNLETRAIPALKPMVEVRSLSLTADDAALVATWAMKTAIIAQEVGERVTTRAQAKAFKAKQEPVPGTKIWLGEYDEKARGNVWTFAWPWVEDYRKPELRANSFLEIFAAGRLLLLVAASRDPDFAGFEPMNRGKKRFVRIWPGPVAITWPPKLPTSDAEVVDIRQTFVVRLNS